MQTLKKKELLREKKAIQDLFENGKEFYLAPFRVKWKCQPSDQDFIAKILFAVPSRNFKKAVDRNRIKRMAREAYRKNKQLLYNAKQGLTEEFLFVLQFSGKTIPTYQYVEAKIILILQRLLKGNEKNSG